MKQQVIDAGLRVTPPVSVAAWQYVLGLPIEKWVAAATLVYIVLQAGFLLYDRCTRTRRYRK